MNTPTSVKAAIDEQITNKTLPYSIDNVDVGERLKDIVDLFTPIQFETTYDRVAYLTNPDAAPFQNADDFEDGHQYYINKDGTAWVLKGDSIAKTEIIFFTNQSSLTVLLTDDRKAKFGDALAFTIETEDDDGKFRQKTGLEIYPDDINDTASYHIDLGGANQTGRLIIK